MTHGYEIFDYMYVDLDEWDLDLEDWYYDLEDYEDLGEIDGIYDDLEDNF